MNPQPNDSPSPWVLRFAGLIPAHGRVLDLACGHGRHARHLAAMGYTVEAVDRDADALAGLADVASVNTRVADLESGPWPFHTDVFDGVVVSRYLYRPLLPVVLKLIAPGGVLIYETFMVGNERFGKPTNPAFLLRPGELLDVIKGRLGVVAFEQGEISAPQPAMMQRLCAMRASGSHLVLPT